jgi:hypothetical protein
MPPYRSLLHPLAFQYHASANLLQGNTESEVCFSFGRTKVRANGHFMRLRQWERERRWAHGCAGGSALF